MADIPTAEELTTYLNQVSISAGTIDTTAQAFIDRLETLIQSAHAAVEDKTRHIYNAKEPDDSTQVIDCKIEYTIRIFPSYEISKIEIRTGLNEYEEIDSENYEIVGEAPYTKIIGDFHVGCAYRVTAKKGYEVGQIPVSIKRAILLQAANQYVADSIAPNTSGEFAGSEPNWLFSMEVMQLVKPHIRGSARAF